MAYLSNSAKAVLLVFSFLFLSLVAEAQQGSKNDTAYYVYFPKSITGRLFTSQKYTRFTFKNKNASDLRYKPNTTFNLGVGATYDNLTLNLAYGFGFLNHNSQKGKTKYLDLQGHFYLRKWITDFEGQLYKGYHLSKGFLTSPGNYYYRGDMNVALFGLSQYYLFNSKRFSYRSSFIQNEWQKKSAGSFLAGAEVYYGEVKADSSLIPLSIADKYGEKKVKQINYFSIGPGIGYAYTLVLFHHLFFTGSLTGNLSFSFANEHLQSSSSAKFSVNPVTRFRIAAGYNGRKWNISANWIADDLPFSAEDGPHYAFNTGNYRVIIARRFATGRRLQKRLHFLDKIFKQ